MKVYLLTHSRELTKGTNTGKIALNVLGDKHVQRIIWERTQPNPELIDLIDREQIALLYPHPDSTNSVDINHYDNFIVLDATWQEARKMFNRSGYLKSAPCAALNTTHASQYNLRRNQVEGGLCTAECLAYLFKQKGHSGLASRLHEAFLQFNGGKSSNI